MEEEPRDDEVLVLLEEFFLLFPDIKRSPIPLSSPMDDEVLVLDKFFLLLDIKRSPLPLVSSPPLLLMLEEEPRDDEVFDINRSPLPLVSSPPLLRLFLFSLLLPSNLDTSFSSLPRNFSDEPGDLSG